MRPRAIATVRHAGLSVLQSALHGTLSRLRGTHLNDGEPAMDALVGAVGESLGEPLPIPRMLSRSTALERCAALAVRSALALARGDAAAAARLRADVRFASCDPLWIETLLTYERFIHSHHGQVYVRHQRLDDFILPPLPDRATVVLIADWGTGTPAARTLLEQIALLSPTAILHLGDIYYSGTPHEVRRHFLDVFTDVFGAHPPRVYALSGNHDRYSGGAGYFQLLEALGQPASYFSLRTRFWQLLALDTGLHDSDPNQAHQELTYLEPSEAQWQRDKLERWNGGTVLLSHHPYFSWEGAGRVAGRWPAVNPALQDSLQGLLEKVSWWFWGHEHNLLLFEPWAGLSAGRCIGAGAVPRLVNEQVNAPVAGLVLPAGERAPPRLLPGTRLGNDGVVDNHAFAVLELDGPAATARYYQVPAKLLASGEVVAPEVFFEESRRAPLAAL